MATGVVVSDAGYGITVNELTVKGRISVGTGLGVKNCGILKLTIVPVTNGLV